MLGLGRSCIMWQMRKGVTNTCCLFDTYRKEEVAEYYELSSRIEKLSESLQVSSKLQARMQHVWPTLTPSSSTWDDIESLVPSAFTV
jgi:hypothetical protein